MLSKFHDRENPQEELYQLFQEIDENDSNCLTRDELQTFLEGYEIILPRKKWLQLFKEIDRNFDDEVIFKVLIFIQIYLIYSIQVLNAKNHVFDIFLSRFFLHF